MVIYNYKKIYSFPGRLFIVSSFALSPPRNYCFSIVSVDYNRRSRSPQAISQLFEWMRANFANRFPILSDKLTTLAPAEWVQKVGFSIIYSSDEISISFSFVCSQKAQRAPSSDKREILKNENCRRLRLVIDMRIIKFRRRRKTLAKINFRKNQQIES